MELPLNGSSLSLVRGERLSGTGVYGYPKLPNSTGMSLGYRKGYLKSTFRSNDLLSQKFIVLARRLCMAGFKKGLLWAENLWPENLILKGLRTCIPVYSCVKNKNLFAFEFLIVYEPAKTRTCKTGMRHYSMTIWSIVDMINLLCRCCCCCNQCQLIKSLSSNADAADAAVVR